MRSGIRLGRDEKIFLVVIAVFSVILGFLIMSPGFLQGGRASSETITSSGVVVDWEELDQGTPDIQVEGDEEPLEEDNLSLVKLAAIAGGCLIGLTVIGGVIAWFYFRKQNQEIRDEEPAEELPIVVREGGGGSTFMADQKQESDPLRDLPNRQDFLREILTALEEVEKDYSQFALFSVKVWLEEGSSIPSQYHHTLLSTVLRRLQEFELGKSLISKISSTEFSVIVRESNNRRQLGEIASRMMDEIKYPIEAGGKDFKLNSNIAVGIYPEVGYNLKTILDNLKWTMEYAVKKGRNEYKIFSEDVIIEIYDEMVLKNHLNTSLEKEEFEVYYQPILDLKDRKIAAVEALLRWKHPNIGMIRPVVFMRLIEDTDLIKPIGAWVVQRVCRDRLLWQEKWLRIPRVHINLSARQLHRLELARMVEQMKEEYALKPGMIEFEVNEHALFEEAPDGVAAMLNAQQEGVRTSVCGFGTPISQLNRLVNFKFHSLKISRQFTENSLQLNDTGKIAPGLINLGKKLGVDVIAEGVENLLELQKLLEYDVRFVQGFFIAEPMPEVALRKLLSMPFDEAFPDVASALE